MQLLKITANGVALTMDREIFRYEPEMYGWQSANTIAAHKYILPKILSLLPSGKLTIIDVGCGNGYMAGKLADLGHRIIGVDSATDGIAIAQRSYADIKFYCRSAYEDFRDICPSADLILASEVIEHLFWPKHFLRNVHKILKNEGHVILTTPYHGYLKNFLLGLFNCWDRHHTSDWEGGHVKFFSEKTLSRILQDCGFNEINYANAGRVLCLWKSIVCCAKKA